MKNSVLLTIFSLLTILLLILHLTTEIAFGLESGGLKNTTGILIVVVWLSGTLLLYERKLGYVIVLVGSLLGTAVPVIHMMGAGLVGGRIGHTHLALFWVLSNFLLGVSALFSVILSARGLWGHLPTAERRAEHTRCPCMRRCSPSHAYRRFARVPAICGRIAPSLHFRLNHHTWLTLALYRKGVLAEAQTSSSSCASVR